MRRRFLLRLFAALPAAALLWLEHRGLPGAGRLVRRMAPNPAPAKVEYYGYREVKLS
ncbi:hypothetical protein [Caldinitratiruptor microaerophilus]|uniref:Uncharacterized protein n=1 Tax=Caldinitratiruptor microaerophilus TaxID=671077 RepID=A0AA35G7M5_9FIRM|nr:hypothetical protein [Caldinitratiruptor microaerophilus]BDG59493.1 hypothetical protein caldi_05830 [Caldinitratiruptor microaerophilus]